MRKVSSQIIEKYCYDTKEEREQHIKEMKEKGFNVDSQKRQFIGNLMIDDDIENDKKYIWVANFYKNN